MDELSRFERSLAAGLEGMASPRRPVDALAVARDAAARRPPRSRGLVPGVRAWWRGSTTTRPAPAVARLAALAATLLVTAGLFLAIAGRTPPPEPTPSQAESPNPSAPRPSPGMGIVPLTPDLQHLSAGRWAVKSPDYVTWPFERLTFELNEAWFANDVSRGAGLRRGPPGLDSDDVPRPEINYSTIIGLGTTPGCQPDPPVVGPTVAELADHFGAIFGVEPSEVDLAGFHGKRLDFTVPLGSIDCRITYGWTGAGAGHSWQPGSRRQLTILDLLGTAFMIDAGAPQGASVDVWSDLERVVASAEFVNVSSTVGKRAEAVSEAATRACAGLAYEACLADFARIAASNPGAFAAICEDAAGDWEIVLVDLRGVECLGHDGSSPGPAVVVVMLP